MHLAHIAPSTILEGGEAHSTTSRIAGAVKGGVKCGGRRVECAVDEIAGHV